MTYVSVIRNKKFKLDKICHIFEIRKICADKEENNP